MELAVPNEAPRTGSVWIVADGEVEDSVWVVVGGPQTGTETEGTLATGAVASRGAEAVPAAKAVRYSPRLEP